MGSAPEADVVLESQHLKDGVEQRHHHRGTKEPWVAFQKDLLELIYLWRLHDVHHPVSHGTGAK